MAETEWRRCDDLTSLRAFLERFDSFSDGVLRQVSQVQHMGPDTAMSGWNATIIAELRDNEEQHHTFRLVEIELSDYKLFRFIHNFPDDVGSLGDAQAFLAPDGLGLVISRESKSIASADALDSVAIAGIASKIQWRILQEV